MKQTQNTHLHAAQPDWVREAIRTLHSAGVRVVAPVEADGTVDLTEVTSPEEVADGYQNAHLPLKRHFFPPTQVLLEFENGEDGEVEMAQQELPEEPTVILGARPCDAAALASLDELFHWDYGDAFYTAARENTTVVTFACDEPGEKCFCTSVGLSPQATGGSDVIAYRTDDGEMLLRPLTDRGEELIANLDGVEPAPEGTEVPDAPEPEKQFDPAQVKQWLDDNFESDFWKEVSLRCLGCGACSYLCPVCHCFDIVDESTWNRGQRRRNWDCCAFGEFTRHASGHNPRPDRASRWRQRVMHKFKYFPEKFDRLGCVGCGRCLENCGAGQDLVEVLGEIEARA